MRKAEFPIIFVNGQAIERNIKINYMQVYLSVIVVCQINITWSRLLNTTVAKLYLRLWLPGQCHCDLKKKKKLKLKPNAH